MKPEHEEIAIQLTDKQYVPEELKTPERNRSTTLRLLSDPTLDSVGMYGNKPIFVVRSGLDSWYFSIHNERIFYYMTCKVFNFPPIQHAACQVGVWRDVGLQVVKRGEGPSLADTVFRTKLLPTYKDILSDKLQTPFGKLFWIKQVGWALDHGKHVYWLRLSGEEIGTIKDIIKIKDWEQFLSLESKTWGKALVFQRIRLLISEKPVFFPPKEEFKRQKDNLGVN